MTITLSNRNPAITITHRNPESLITAANDFLVGASAGLAIKKTLAETQALIGGVAGAGVLALQSATPGTAQTGSFNITGTGILGNIILRSPTAPVASGSVLVKQSGSSDGFLTQASANDSFITINANGTVCNIGSSYQATAGYKPLTFSTSDTERLRLTVAGNFLFGNLASAGTSAVSVIGCASGTAPTTAPADMAQIWVADLNGAGTAGFRFMNEVATTVYTLTGVSGVTAASSGVGSVKMGSTNAADNAGWLTMINHLGVVVYVPYWTAAAP